MRPHTPVLLTTTALALAQHARVLPRRHPEMPCSLEFVHLVGITSHLTLETGCSSWPVAAATSLAALRAMADAQHWRRTRPMAGDLLLAAPPSAAGDGSPSADAGAPGAGDEMAEEVSIVVGLLDRGLTVAGTVRRCALVVARPLGAERMALVEEVRWVDARCRALAIRWSAGADEVERAA